MSSVRLRPTRRRVLWLLKKSRLVVDIRQSWTVGDRRPTKIWVSSPRDGFSVWELTAAWLDCVSGWSVGRGADIECTPNDD